jgi:large subunit ribosomal protein L54
MICRTCLRRAAGLTSQRLPSLGAKASPARSFATTLAARNASPTPVAAAPATATAAPSSDAAPDLTPLTPPPAEAKAAPLSSCPAGTPLNGLNYFKGKTDPVALPDEAYPAWLWKCLEVQKKATDTADADAGDEFCTFKLSPLTYQCHTSLFSLLTRVLSFCSQI